MRAVKIVSNLGIVIGRLSGSDEVIAANTPPGYTAVDIEPGEIVTLPGLDSLPQEARDMRLRNERDVMLRDSDWTQLPDAPVPGTARVAWQQYRQALRDLPSTPQFRDPTQWPQKPT